MKGRQKSGKLQEESLTRLADAAFRQVAAAVIQRAKQAATPGIVWEGGRMKAIPAEIMEARMRRKSEREASDERHKERRVIMNAITVEQAQAQLPELKD